MKFNADNSVHLVLEYKMRIYHSNLTLKKPLFVNHTVFANSYNFLTSSSSFASVSHSNFPSYWDFFTGEENYIFKILFCINAILFEKNVSTGSNSECS